MTSLEPRSKLRQLPLPAKVVLTVFLLAVGLGYFSAMVQLHMQHSSRNGEPLPSADDVVAIFAGVKKFDPKEPLPTSKLEKLVMGPRGKWSGSISMADAFYEKDGADYKSTIKDDPDAKPKLDAERAGEQKAVQTWINLNEEERKAAYESDALKVSIAPITKDYLAGETIKIKSILTDRCVRCHSKAGDKPEFPLETYEQCLKYMTVPRAEPDPWGYIPSGRQTSIEKLTQSTHAHLLSFAMLFGLTGFIFAFTGYPSLVRLFFAPLVLIAQVADVSCWWLARIPGSGPYFAQLIMLTGGLVGMGLTIHILGSIFDMYSRRGRGVMLLVFLVGVAGFGGLYTKVLEPALKEQKTSVRK